MQTQFCVHERARRTILRARKSVHANIKFVEPCVYYRQCAAFGNHIETNPNTRIVL